MLLKYDVCRLKVHFCLHQQSGFVIFISFVKSMYLDGFLISYISIPHS